MNSKLATLTSPRWTKMITNLHMHMTNFRKIFPNENFRDNSSVWMSVNRFLFETNQYWFQWWLGVKQVILSYYLTWTNDGRTPRRQYVLQDDKLLSMMIIYNICACKYLYVHENSLLSHRNDLIPCACWHPDMETLFAILAFWGMGLGWG